MTMQKKASSERLTKSERYVFNRIYIVLTDNMHPEDKYLHMKAILNKEKVTPERLAHYKAAMDSYIQKTEKRRKIFLRVINPALLAIIILATRFFDFSFIMFFFLPITISIYFKTKMRDKAGMLLITEYLDRYASEEGFTCGATAD